MIREMKTKEILQGLQYGTPEIGMKHKTYNS
jgi:hypothetical protein